MRGREGGEGGGSEGGGGSVRVGGGGEVSEGGAGVLREESGCGRCKGRVGKRVGV